MGRYRARAVQNDRKIVAELSGVFLSLGSEHPWARSQPEARRRLADDTYSHVVPDLNIPARSKGGIPSIRNGLNLMEEVLAAEGPPVIVLMSCDSHSKVRPSNAIEFAAAVTRKGAAYAVCKPVPGGSSADNRSRRVPEPQEC